MSVARIAAFAVAVALVAAVAGAADAPQSGLAADLAEHGITVSGTGTVTSVPDRAEFGFGVQSQARTASAALAANAADMRKVIAALKDAGVAAADIQTQQVSLSPRYTDNGEDIVGYTATNSVSAKIKDIDRSGAVIDAAVAAGANQVFGPSLTRSDASGLYRDALKAAVADARAKAQAIAGPAGVALGKVIDVQEAGASPQPLATARVGAAPDSTPIEPGTQETQAMVTVTFSVV